jgi:glycosyltransferase involved in cell wall biosynthesis
MKPDISIFFPAYNEEGNIKRVIEDAASFLKANANEYEIMVVLYEGSTDNTINITKELMKKDNRVRLIIQPKDKKGVGYAIRMGFEASRYPHIFYTDADNQFELSEFSKFLPYLGDCDIVAGFRLNREQPFARIMTSHVYNLIVRLVFGVREKDVDCAFRYVNRRVFERVKLTCMLGLGTTEILVKAHQAGFKIKQIGVRHYARRSGQPVFEGAFLNLPRPGVVLDLLKEMARLKRELEEAAV